jgi:hypothetical protein
MTKEEIQTLIDTKLATGSNITASEHREVETALLNFIGTFSPIKCYGKIGPVDIKGSATSYTVTGNIVSASKITPVGNYQPVRVVMPTGSFPDTNYKIRIDVESGATYGADQNNDIRPVLFQKVDALTFDICLEENANVSQDLYFHIEAVAI